LHGLFSDHGKGSLEHGVGEVHAGLTQGVQDPAPTGTRPRCLATSTRPSATHGEATGASGTLQLAPQVVEVDDEGVGLLTGQGQQEVGAVRVGKLAAFSRSRLRQAARPEGQSARLPRMPGILGRSAKGAERTAAVPGARCAATAGPALPPEQPVTGATPSARPEPRAPPPQPTSRRGPAYSETIAGLRGVRPSWPSHGLQASAPLTSFAAPSVDAGRLARRLPAGRTSCRRRDQAAIQLQATARRRANAQGHLTLGSDAVAISTCSTLGRVCAQGSHLSP